MSENNLEGRSITIARVRAGMTSVEVARRLNYTVTTISLWETGVRKPHWDELCAILPELPEIREKGCAAYCPKAAWCKQDGNCLIARGAKSKGYLQPDYVNVVRCKCCVHFDENNACFCHAADENGTPIFVREHDFCSYGERRATNEAD